MEQFNFTTSRVKYKHFSETERYKLEAYLSAGLTVEDIAKKLKRHKSTIYREIKRGLILLRMANWDEEFRYRAHVAQANYLKKVSNRERSLKIGSDKALEEHIREHLIIKRYSPDVIIGEIKAKGLHFDNMICTKTLYSYIHKGIFAEINNKLLWEKSKKKDRKKQAKPRVSWNNREAKSIEERPEAANDRIEYGHWEGDCVKGPRGKSRTGLFTLTERLTREEIIIKIKNITQESILKALNSLEHKYGLDFKNKFKSITLDNGCEFLGWQLLEKSCIFEGMRTKTYFAHAYSSWERGTNENHNRMIRRFIPKGTNINKYSKDKIQEIEDWMNNYPRRIFGYKTPNEMVLQHQKGHMTFN